MRSSGNWAPVARESMQSQASRNYILSAMISAPYWRPGFTDFPSNSLSSHSRIFPQRSRGTCAARTRYLSHDIVHYKWRPELSGPRIVLLFFLIPFQRCDFMFLWLHMSINKTDRLQLQLTNVDVLCYSSKKSNSSTTSRPARGTSVSSTTTFSKQRWPSPPRSRRTSAQTVQTAALDTGAARWASASVIPDSRVPTAPTVSTLLVIC